MSRCSRCLIRNAFALIAVSIAAWSFVGGSAEATASTRLQSAVLPNPILFATQVPIPYDFTNVASVFGNHLADPASAPRGGDLYILYPDGSLRNLTLEAGFGTEGFQGANSIAVREPSVHFSGMKALFSMVVGASQEQYERGDYHWQLYEASGLAKGQTAVIERVPNQPEDFNNISPLYAGDGAIIFTSDRPRNGAAHLYPQLDEYEEAPTNTGLWLLHPQTGELRLLDHAPSGDFKPILDSFGRVLFTRWDHLQRDQQADADVLEGNVYGTFDYSDESPLSVALAFRTEVFPEPRSVRTDLLEGAALEGLSFNHFFPWMAQQDGTGLETLNHIGRHELHSYFDRSFNDDPSLREFISEVEDRANPNPIQNFLQIREDPLHPGRYFGVDAPEFFTHGAGQIVALTAPPGMSADGILVDYITHRDTSGFTEEGAPVPGTHSGLYRSPLPLSDGSLIAVHTAETRQDRNQGSRAAPLSRYDLRLKRILPQGEHFQAASTLTPGIAKSVSYYDPDVLVSYDGPLWELDPVEVEARAVPPMSQDALPPPEASVFGDKGIDVAAFREYLRERNLALIVSRDVTTRDDADHQQPFNLRAPGGAATTVGDGGKVYGVAYLQLFQGDQVRGIGGAEDPNPGRRVLARAMHDDALANPPHSGPPGSVRLGTDGSMAALVPAHRALSYQMTNEAGSPVVRERYWLTFQAGEIRVCTSCHGINHFDQEGNLPPINPPQALRDLLDYWQASQSTLFEDGFEKGNTSDWTSSSDDGGLSVVPSAALQGSFGLAVDLGGGGYVEHVAAQPRRDWRVRILVNADAVAIDSQQVTPRRRKPRSVDLLALSGQKEAVLVDLALRIGTQGTELQARMRRDRASFVETSWTQILAGSREIELQWRGADDSSPVASLVLKVDGQTVAQVSSGNSTHLPASRLRLGALAASPAIRGNLILDGVVVTGL